VFPDKRDKAAGDVGGDRSVSFFFEYQLQKLRFGRADGDDEASGFFELGKERGGTFGGSGGDEYGVVGGMVGKAEGAVADDEGDVAAGEAIEDRLGLGRESGVALDGVDVATEFSEQGGLVSGAGADFEDYVGGVEAEEFEHEGDDVGLGDGLSFPDRKRRVVVSVLAKRGAYEFMARDPGHDGEDSDVADAALGELSNDHSLAEVGEVEVGGWHRASSFWLLASGENNCS
jgi:hypothetical protein